MGSETASLTAVATLLLWVAAWVLRVDRGLQQPFSTVSSHFSAVPVTVPIRPEVTFGPGRGPQNKRTLGRSRRGRDGTREGRPR